jgi:tetratricopeptide (TPR) repeat protein
VKRVAGPVFAAVLLGLGLGGCAGGALRDRPPRELKVIELGRQGQAAYLRGDLERAGRLFEQALGDARRIEDSEGVAVMSVNLARVRREAGDSSKALATLEAVAPWHRGHIAAATGQEMDLLAAVLQSDLGRPDEALGRVQALREQCQSSCAMAIGIDSLQARLLLEKGDPGAAARLATTAIARFGAHANRLELANLFRLQGEANLALGDFPAARQSLGHALDIDKSLAQPTKIAQDLDALARSALAAGDMAAHAGYLARLEEVRQARADRSSR